MPWRHAVDPPLAETINTPIAPIALISLIQSYINLSMQFPKYLITFIIIISLFLLASQASAYGWGDITGFYTETGGAAGLSAAATPQFIIGKIIQIALGFVGALFVILMIWGGISWMASTGNEEKVTKARKIMIWAVIGLAVVIAAYSITLFVIKLLPAK